MSNQYTYVKGRYTAAHRLSFALSVTDFPLVIHVLHKCDNPQCINPSHLFLGTNLDNCEDRAKKLRGTRKLTVEDVLEISRLNQAGVIGDEIAERLNVSRMAVYDVLQKKTYKHINRPDAINNRRGIHNGNSRVARAVRERNIN